MCAYYFSYSTSLEYNGSMYTIVGLGNPEPAFDKTRHNAGFMIINDLARVMLANGFELNKKCNAYIAKTSQKSTAHCLFIKPGTYMNESGLSVRAALDYYDVEDWQQQLFVIHDDLDLELGSFKIQFGTGPALHNGLLSLYQHLGSKNFWHVRIGVDGRGGDRTIPPQTYVTQHFSDNELGVFRRMQADVLAAMTIRLKSSILT